MTTKQESLESKNAYIIIVTLSVLALMFTVQPWVYASSNNDDDDDDDSSNGQTENRGIIGNFADGRQAGLADGASDYRSGYAEFARCPGGSLDYCAGYDNGYHDGYSSARKVG